MLTILKRNGFCLNCLNPGHHLKQYPSVHRCQRCQRPHHTWLHLDIEANPQRQTNASPSLSQNIPCNVMSHTSQSSDHRHRVLVMTCWVRIIAPDGSSTIAKAPLDSVSSTSFITERQAPMPPLTASIILSHANQQQWRHHRAFRFARSS